MTEAEIYELDPQVLTDITIDEVLTADDNKDVNYNNSITYGQVLSNKIFRSSKAVPHVEPLGRFPKFPLSLGRNTLNLPDFFFGCNPSTIIS